MARQRRTKARYARLFDNPASLFPNVETLLFPNGEPEIWFKDRHGYGFRVRVSSGNAGIAIQVDRFVGGAPFSVSGNGTKEQEWKPFGLDADNVSVCQHRMDEYAQKFKVWYRSDSVDGKHTVPHPAELGLQPEVQS